MVLNMTSSGSKGLRIMREAGGAFYPCPPLADHTVQKLMDFPEPMR
jgi:hypothetical protein